jgi:hypothetical protein
MAEATRSPPDRSLVEFEDAMLEPVGDLMYDSGGSSRSCALLNPHPQPAPSTAKLRSSGRSSGGEEIAPENEKEMS